MSLTNENYVSQADAVMHRLMNDRYGRNLTTTKIRKILSMVSDLYTEARLYATDLLDQEILGKLQYLKLHIVYEAGRERLVENFVKEAGLLSEIDAIGTSRKQLILFCHYMEALVAYHRFYGGRDN